jgi:hypothetical protein
VGRAFLFPVDRSVPKSYRNNQQDVTVYYNLLFQCFLIAQHVSSDTPLIIGSSKTVIASSGFTIKKHWNNKFYYTVTSCWSFLYDLYYDARIHEHQEVCL